MADLNALTEAWKLARSALDASNEALRVAKAGNETAVQCEREAWEAMSKCREQDEKPAPRVATSQETLAALRRAHEQQSCGTFRADRLVSYMGTSVVGLSASGGYGNGYR